jgi:hypothetical protein
MTTHRKHSVHRSHHTGVFNHDQVPIALAAGRSRTIDDTGKDVIWDVTRDDADSKRFATLNLTQAAQDAKTKAAAEVKVACKNHALLNDRLGQAPLKQQWAVVQQAAEEKFNELMRHTLTVVALHLKSNCSLRCVWFIPRCTNDESHETRQPKLPCRGKRCLHASA